MLDQATNQLTSGDGSMALIRGTRFDDRLVGHATDDLIFGYGGNDTLLGNGGDDTLRGGRGSDVLNGGTGDDRLYDYARERTGDDGSLDLHNVLNGGRGDDNLSTHATVDLYVAPNATAATASIHQDLAGGAGDDHLHASIAIDILDTSSWVPDVDATVRLDGGDGNDSLTASATADAWMFEPERLDFSFYLDGGRGNDTLDLTVTGGAIEKVDAVLDGGDGNDVIRALIQPDEFTASVAHATVNGGAGDDDILLRLDPNAGMSFTGAGLVADAGSGDDRVVVFAQAADISVNLHGGSGNDVILLNEDASEGGANGFGSAHNRISGGDGNDSVQIAISGVYDLDATVSGGRGNDTISLAASGESFGEESHYRSALFGNDGDDILTVALAGSGSALTYHSLLDGGAGNDTLVGSAVADTLVGGAGADQMTGGAGDDVFVFGRDAGSAKDVVTDFTTGADHFDLGAFNLDPAGLQALLAASSGSTLALSTIGGRDVTLAGLDVHDLSTTDFIL